MKIEASTPKEYLDQLPDQRKKDLGRVRRLVRKSLPKGSKEVMKWGMISYEVPNKRDGSPRVSVTLGNQKNYMAMYFSHVYRNEKEKRRFKELYEKGGQKLDMGKACLRFKKIEDLNLGFIEKLLMGKVKL